MMNRRVVENQAGFTLLELMFVMAIASILAVIALPIYFDFSTRAKVSEGVNQMGSIKTKVTETYYSSGVLPADNSSAGMSAAADYATDKITQIYLGTGGVITVEFAIPELGAGNLLSFRPTPVDGGVAWTCEIPAVNGVPEAYVPPECR